MGESRILDRNLLIPLQGKLRQDGGLEREDTLVTDAEDDEIAEVPNIPVLPKVRPAEEVRSLITFPPSQWRVLKRLIYQDFAPPSSKC